MRGIQQIGQRGVAQAGQHAFIEFFLGAPNPVVAQRHGHGPAGRQRVLDALQAANVFGQRPVHQHLGLAFGLQAVNHARRAHRLSGQHRLGQLEHVVAGHVEHGVFNLRQTQGAPAFTLTLHRVEQRQLLNFLVRGEQVAFNPIGKKLQGVLAFLAAGHALALQLQALGNPLRQHAPVYRIKLDRDAKTVQRAKPGALERCAIKPWQQYQRQRAVVALRTLGELLQRGRSLLAGLAVGDADFNDLLVGKQAERAAAGQHLAPVKMCTGHGVDGALGIAFEPRGSAQRVGKLLHQQRLVAIQGVEAFQAALEVL